MNKYVVMLLMVTATQGSAQQDERSRVSKEQQEITLPQPPSPPQPPVVRKELPTTETRRPVPPQPFPLNLPPQSPGYQRQLTCYDLPLTFRERCTDTRNQFTQQRYNEHLRPVTPWQCMQVPPTTRPVCFQHVRRDRIRQELRDITPQQRRAIQEARREFQAKVTRILRRKE